ncbi:MAG: hypothetical protein KIH01_00510, partial [Candidatus Freyarchaeota archaeon]|nr:hypothetical protein [Candidatus Jordarchaeia archaeon]
MSRRGMSTIEALRIADFSVLGCSIDGDAFGFSVGPMGLSRRGAERLASEVAEAIRMLNNLLLEESGVKLEYAEFELVGRERGNLPEAMALVTGGGEEEAGFIVLLEHEKELVDVFKFMEVANDVLDKLRDIKLACRASGLRKEEEREVLRRFVERFTRKIYAEVSQKKYREKYARDLLTHLKITSGLTVEGKIEVDYGAKPPKFSSIIERISFEGHATGNLEYLKSLIFTKTALEVLAGDVALIGRKILSLINDYTVDEVEEGVASRLAEAFWSRTKPGPLQIEEIMEEVKLFIEEGEEAFRRVSRGVEAILHAGEKRPLKQHLDAVESGGLSSCFKKTLISFLSEKNFEEEVWSWSLKDELAYFLEHAERGLRTFERALSAFFFMVAERETARGILEDYTKQVVDPIRRLMVKAYIEKIKKRLESFIEDRSLGVPVSWDISTLRDRLKEELASLGVEARFSTVELLEITFDGFISEVPSEMRGEVEEVYRDIREHVSEAVPGLADYLLSHNVLKKFLEQSQPDDSPESFSRKYYDFISSDLKEFPKWESLAKTWFEAFASSSKKATDTYKLVTEFVGFVNKLRDEETLVEKPKEMLEAKIKAQQEKVDALTKKLSELSVKKA